MKMDIYSKNREH